MVNSPVNPDSELVFALIHSIAKSRFPGAYDAHKSVPAIQGTSTSDSQSDLGRPFIDRFPRSLYCTCRSCVAVRDSQPPFAADTMDLQPIHIRDRQPIRIRDHNPAASTESCPAVPSVLGPVTVL
jgi:hypothetical protein